MGNAQPLEHYLSTAIKHKVVRAALGPLSLVKYSSCQIGLAMCFKGNSTNPATAFQEYF